MNDKQKEYLIACYLVQEISGAKYCSSETQEALSQTVPYPEMAHDLLQLVRILDKQTKLLELLGELNRVCAKP